MGEGAEGEREEREQWSYGWRYIPPLFLLLQKSSMRNMGEREDTTGSLYLLM